MFLVFDVGNTRLKWASYEAPKRDAPLIEQGVRFLERIDTLAEQDLEHLPQPIAILGCVVAGDAVRRRVQEQLELWDITPRWVVSSAQEAGLINGYDQPTRLGSDRWVAMIGARSHLLKRQQIQPCLVVMVGTAVTVEAIDEQGRFLGGLILPGHGIMLRALESGTAGLHVPTGNVIDFPTNTSDALTSGGTFAIAGAIERMHRHLEQKTGLRPACFITGGAAWKMAPYLGIEFELIESLIFDGLLEIGHHRYG